MFRFTRFILMLFIVHICTFFYACPQPEQSDVLRESLSEQDFKEGKAALSYEEALVVFVSGEVFVKGTGDWEYLEIGNIVYPGEVVRVEADSMCELQFGQQSVVRVQEDTEIALNDLWLEPEKTAADIELVLGSVLCKVSMLAGPESFKVRTPTTVCGVRGTEFLVRVTDANDTVLAVKKGAVAIMPESAEALNIEEQTHLDNENLKRLVRKMEDMAVVVTERQEVTIDEQTAQHSRQLVKKMVDEVKKADQDEGLSEEELEKTVSALVADTDEKIKKNIPPPKRDLGRNRGCA